MAKAGFRKAKLAHEVQKNFLDKPMSFEQRNKMAAQQESDRAFEETSEKNDAFGRKRRMDPLTESLGATCYYHKMRFAWLCEMIGGINYPMEVTRYYQEIKVAIDIGPEDPKKIELKKQLFEMHEIKYIVLETANDMKTLSEGLT